MRYFLGTWAHDSPDDPVRMAYEVTEDRAVLRRIESFPDGRTECETAADQGLVSLVHGDCDVSSFELNDLTMTLTEITAQEFERLWAERRSLPAEFGWQQKS